MFASLIIDAFILITKSIMVVIRIFFYLKILTKTDFLPKMIML